MTEENIRNYAKLMKELDLTGVEVTEGDTKIRLERGAYMRRPDAEPVQGEYLQKKDDAAQESVECTDEIRSPMVGIFYSAPSEDAKPYVSAGDSVKKGDVLCIIEAMKLMNEITAEKDGTITEICAVNGQTVEYGTVLFKIK